MSIMNLEGMEVYTFSNDLVFKYLFILQKDNRLLKSFLNHTLQLNIQSEKDIILMNSEIPNHPELKSSVLDILVSLEHQIIHIEIQVQKQGNLYKRAEYYYGKLIAMQHKKGYTINKDEQAKRIISLWLLDYELEEVKKGYLHPFALKHISEQIIMSPNRIILVELPKLRKEEVKEDNIWLKLIAAKKEEELKKIASQVEEIDEAIGVLKHMNKNKKLIEQFKTREEEKLFEEMEKKEHYNYGHQEGTKQGLELGTKQKTQEVAKKMKLEGFDIEVICKLTELSKEEIKKL